MIVKAYDPSLNKEVSAKNAIKGRVYLCPYCRTKLHVCQKRFFARFPEAPEHSNTVCIAMISKLPPDVEHQLRKTNRDDIFGRIMRGRDLLGLPEPPSPSPPPLPPSGDPVALDFPIIETDSLERFPTLEPTVKVLRDLDIDYLNCEDYKLDVLGITHDDIIRLAADIDDPAIDILPADDTMVLETLVREEVSRVERHVERHIEGPIRTLRQFDKLGLIFMVPHTKLADCTLIDLFLSFYRHEYRAYFMDNYTNLGGRILYCRFWPFRELDEGDRPSLRFTMFWNNPEKSNVTLYINFLSDDEHTARERYEFFAHRMLEQRALPDGTPRWVPRGATEEEIQRGYFDALVFGQWENAEKNDVVRDGCHYISLRTQYFNARQILFTKGYNQ